MRKVIMIVPVLTPKREKEFLEVLGVHIPGMYENDRGMLEAPVENVTWDMINRMRENTHFTYETRED